MLPKMRLYMKRKQSMKASKSTSFTSDKSYVLPRRVATWLLAGLILAFSLNAFAQTPPASVPLFTGPLTLRQVVALALQNNLTLKVAHDGLDAAKTKVPQALSHYLPQVNFDETFTRGNNPVYVFGSLLTQRQFGMENFNIAALNQPEPLDNFQAKVSVEQVLYDAGKIRGYVGQAKLGQQMAEKDVEKTKQELIFRVIKAYTMHLLARSAEQVAQDAVKTAEAVRARADSMYQSGMIVESDKLAAQVFLARMREMLLQAQNNVALSRANLNFEMGVPVDSPLEIVGNLKELQFQAEPQDSLFATALQQRPDYLQTVLMQDIARKNVSIARSEFLPQAGLFGSWEADSQTFTQRAGSNWMIGARLHFNLFKGGADKAQLAEAKVNLERSRAVNNLASSAVKLQIKQASQELETTRQRIEVMRSAIAQAEEGLRIVQNRYGAGLTTITDLLRAQTDLTQARTAYYQAIYDHRTAKANIELASGTLSDQSESLNQ
jgi:outer membrane protein TolC